jgi:hypothetical protein
VTLREIAEKKLYFRYGKQLCGGMSFWFVDTEQPDPENTVVIRDGDCGEVRRPHTIPRAEFDDRVKRFGLWKQTGLWDFARADDPAVPSIRYCHRNPAAAGTELYRVRERLRRIEWIARLYDAAVIRMEEAYADMDGTRSAFGAFDRACKIRDRVRKWLPGAEEAV